MVREAISWLDRILPLSARFPKGSYLREDYQPVPAEALREVLLNAVMHRDYSRHWSHVAVAVFDDRIEVRSVGTFPSGIDAAMLSGDHPSILRNPLIAGAFHRTGAVEVWGRGTNRVVDVCRAHGLDAPAFSESGGVVTVTFRADILAGVRPGATNPDGEMSPTPGLTERQKIVLRLLAQKTAMPLRELGPLLEEPLALRRLREELLHLKRLGLVLQSGYGRGSTWRIAESSRSPGRGGTE